MPWTAMPAMEGLTTAEPPADLRAR
jgi:hypothetical protein